MVRNEHRSDQIRVQLTLEVKAADGSVNGTVDLPAELFDAPANISLLHQVVIAQQAAKRQGTTRPRPVAGSAVAAPSRTARRAPAGRQGSTRAPQFVGGGTVHGPQPRDYSQRTPKKMKAAACAEPLGPGAQRAHPRGHRTGRRAGSVHQVGARLLESLSDRKKFLVVLARRGPHRVEERGEPAERLPIAADQLNTYDVLDSDDVVFSVETLTAFIAANTKTAKTEEA